MNTEKENIYKGIEKTYEKQNIEKKIEKENREKNIEKTYKTISYYALLIYITMTIFIMIWAFLKKAIWNKGTPNDADKFFRLINFLWLPPLKIYIILNIMIGIIELVKQMLGIVYVKKKDKEFPPAFLFFLNYGILFCLILYALFPKEIYIIIIFAILVGVGTGLSKTGDNISVFPFQLSNLAKEVYNQFEKMTNSKDSHVIEIIWLLLIILIVFIIIFLSILGITLTTILLCYFVVFVYTFRIPTIPESLKGLSKVRDYGIGEVSKVMKPFSNAKSYLQSRAIR